MLDAVALFMFYHDTVKLPCSPIIRRHRPGSSGVRARCAGPLGAGGAGFTLVELIVVLAIVGLLAILLVPAYKATIAKAQGSQCLSNMRQIYIASTSYANDNRGMSLPAQTEDGNTKIFWHWSLRPYLGASNVWDTKMDDKVRCPTYKPRTLRNYWAWGYGINSKPGIEGAGTGSPMNRFNWYQVNVTTPATWQGPFLQTQITHQSKRLFICDAIEWQGTPPSSAAGSASFPDYTRHGSGNGCNVLFYDGHAEPCGKAAINKALFDPGAP